MQAVVKRKNKKDWVFKWDGKAYTMVTHYGNVYRLALDDSLKVEVQSGPDWKSNGKTNDTVRPTQVIFSL
jgi:hypothetical protein